MPSSSRAFALLAIGFVLYAAPAQAAPTPTDDADALVLQGVERFKQQDYEAARVAFARSYELAPRTGTLLNLALAELQAGRALIATKHFRQFLRAPDATLDKIEYVRTKMLPRAEALTSRIVIDAPAGADVIVDGTMVGRAPLNEPVDVDAGDHVVEVRFGKSTQRVTTTTTLGVAARVRVETGAVSPGADSTPLPSPRPTDAMTAAPSQTSQGFFTARNTTVIVLAGSALVATGLGVGFGIASSSDADDAQGLRAQLQGNSACAARPGQQLPSQCAALADASSSQSTHHNLAVGFYIGGAALAVGAIATWVFWPSSKEGAPRAWVRPMLGSTSGFEVGGAF